MTTASSVGGGPPRPVDVAVVGDGPAGSALASQCRRLGLDVVLVGADDAWTATYATWIDDLAGVELPADDELLQSRVDVVAVHAEGLIEVARPYGVFDNAVLRRHLRGDLEHVVGRVRSVRTASSGTHAGRHRVIVDGGADLDARLVVDATGWPSSFARRVSDAAPAWQTALGVVLPEPPSGDLGRPTLMDFRTVGSLGRPSTVGPHDVTTFCYSLPVAGGWLVEETVLAARPAVEPIALLPRLSARLGQHPDDVLATAIRTEYVRIPMGGARPVLDQPVVAFGAAAGYVHAATGFSVASSLRAAPRVAAAIATALDATSAAVDARLVAEAVWPSEFRRSRVLHDYGLEVLLRLDDDEVREFFDAFFRLPVEQIRRYMRIDSPPADVAGVMSRLFRSASWSMRRRLVAGNPAAFARLLRP
jgi:lycopene beta-cyclase